MVRNLTGSQLLASRKTVEKWVTIAAAAVIVGASLLPVAAEAQFFGWGGRQYRSQQQQQAPSRGFFFPFFRPFGDRPSSDRPSSGRSHFGRPYYTPRSAQQPSPFEPSRAPSPRKPASQPTSTVVVIGDSMADWLAYGLEEVYADQPQTGIVRNIRPNSGLIHYGPRNDSLEWSQAVKEMLANEKPAAIVVMLGLNDRVPLRVPAPPRQAAQRDGKDQANQPAQKQEKGQAQKQEKSQERQKAPVTAQGATAANESTEGGQSAAPAQPGPGLYDFHTDDWATLYRKRVDDMIAALKSKGVPVLWVGLPALRGPHATADMGFLDDLYRASADKAAIDYVDVWNGFVDENGRYSAIGPDFEGQTRRLRSGDGVHFTNYGALKLAHLVDQELSRALANPVAPAAPSTQAAAPSKPGAAQPAAGPVVPLTAPGGARIGNGGGAGQNGQLLGGGQPAAADPASAAAAVLVRGDPPPAPAGRADNFAWPPPANEPTGTKKQ
jgi:hypothetical protein